MFQPKIKNKRAVSLLVSYTLLIVIAVGISAITYSYLKLYLPSDKPRCSEDIHAIIKEAACGSFELNIEIKNAGLFNITVMYVRFGRELSKVREQIPENKGENAILDTPLAPGATLLFSFPRSSLPQEEGNYTLEIQPGVLSGRKIVMCEKAVVTEKIYCPLVP